MFSVMTEVGAGAQRLALTERETRLLAGQIRRKRLSLAFSILSLAAALVFAGRCGISGKLSGPDLVIVVLMLIGSKNHMRIYRLAALLERLAGLERPPGSS